MSDVMQYVVKSERHINHVSPLLTAEPDPRKVLAEWARSAPPQFRPLSIAVPDLGIDLEVIGRCDTCQGFILDDENYYDLEGKFYCKTCGDFVGEASSVICAQFDNAGSLQSPRRAEPITAIEISRLNSINL